MHTTFNDCGSLELYRGQNCLERHVYMLKQCVSFSWAAVTIIGSIAIALFVNNVINGLNSDKH